MEEKVLIDLKNISTAINWLKNGNRVSGLNILPQAEVDEVVGLLSQISKPEAPAAPKKAKAKK